MSAVCPIGMNRGHGLPVAGRIDIAWDLQIYIVAILLDCHALIGFQVRYHRSFGA
jgi:hypothetical protein